MDSTKLKPHTAITLCCALSFLLTGCSSSSDPGDVSTQAYVAPAQVNLRSQLNAKTGAVAIVKHGERVNVIDVRRRYVRVRTAKGATGWLDASDLLNSSEMNQLTLQRRRALALPSEGSAVAYEALNIHLAPNRRSPAFAQIPEGGAVMILSRTVSPKDGGPEHLTSFVPERPPQTARRPRKDKPKTNGFKLPPPPPPPKPPSNWVALSNGEETEGVSPAITTPKTKEAASDSPIRPAVLESWNLIRTRSDQVGWVLSRNLMMSIPDEVAQYAEGKHITSFFSLGSVNDQEKGVKQNWLWTTISGTENFDFDSWRVFLWNRRRHRYETSYRQRDLEGYFPVEVEPPDSATLGRAFKLITKDDDGKFRRRAYVFDGSRVHLTGTEDYSFNGGRSPAVKSMTPSDQRPAVDAPQPSWLRRKWEALKQRFSPPV